MRKSGLAVVLLAALPAGCAVSAADPDAPREVIAGCAACVFELPGLSGCPLAIRWEGAVVLVRGVPTPDHASGICDRQIRALARGTLQDDTFVATEFAVVAD
jgi:hypothetical protein